MRTFLDSDMSRRPARASILLRFRTLLTGLALLPLAWPVHATVYCVGTVSELQAAVATINSAAQQGKDIDLRLRSGTFFLTQVPGQTHALRIVRDWHKATGESGTHRISGAWTAGCTSQAATIDAISSTLLDGQELAAILQVESRTLDPRPPVDASLTISTLQFARGRVSTGAGMGACLDYRRTAGSSGSETRLAVLVDRVRFDLCDGGAVKAHSAYGTTVRNSVFIANTGGLYSAMELIANVGPVWVHNNTLRDNALIASSNAGHIRLLDTHQSRVYNNVIAENVPAPGANPIDLWVQGAVDVRHNRIGEIHHFGGPNVQIVGNTSINPGFLNAWNPRLGASSPLRDFGSVSVPGSTVGMRDFLGGLRIRGASVEPGAFELPPLDGPPPQAAVFKNGFE